MNPWALLGIEPTKDRRAIKRAYAKLLQVHRPDEDQAAFERLRRAYEQALAYAEPPEKTPSLPSVDFTPPGAELPLPEFLVTPPRVEPPSPPPPEPELLPPELLQLENPPPELGPLLEKVRRQERLRRPQSPEETAAPPEIPLPPPPKTPRAIVNDIMDFAWQHRHEPVALAAFLAEQPDLFNLAVKAEVSLELASRLLNDSQLPVPMQPPVFRFFEWDTFTEQRRIGAKLKKLDKLRFLLSAAELQQHLDAASAGKEGDATRRQLAALRAAGSGWRSWVYAWLHPLRDRQIRRALAEGDRRYGSDAVRAVVGHRSVKFWNHIFAPRPNPIQGLLLLSRLAWLNAILVLPILVLSLILEKDNPALVAVGMMESLAATASLFFFGRWLVRSGGQLWTHYVWKSLARGIHAVGLMERRALFAALVLLLTGATFFWPLNWSGLYIVVALAATLVLTLTDSNALIGLMLTLLGGMIVVTVYQPPRLHWYLSSWLLAGLYVQWLGYWLHKWIKRRNPATRFTAAGVGALLGAAFMVGAIVFLNLTKH